mmetsp:Transcript_4282/g.9233  ORF Transcript_4282/g.9233 Transcript_4282/m.9233 type:complete len:706 (-) Transcript_4282:94-2211(-)
MGAPRLLSMRTGNHNRNGSADKARIRNEAASLPLSTVPLSSTSRQYRRSYFSRKYNSSPSSTSSSSSSTTSSSTDSSPTATATAAVVVSREGNEHNLDDVPCNVADERAGAQGEIIANERDDAEHCPGVKRMVHLTITADADSEGVQIDLEDDSRGGVVFGGGVGGRVDGEEPWDDDGRRIGGRIVGELRDEEEQWEGKERNGEVSMIYSVGSVDYVVRHKRGPSAEVGGVLEQQNVGVVVGGGGGEGSGNGAGDGFDNDANANGNSADDEIIHSAPPKEDTEQEENRKQHGEVMAGGENEAGKKSKFGSFLKGGKKGGGDQNGETNNHGGDSSNTNGGGGENHSPDNGNNGQGNENDKNNNNSNDDENNKKDDDEPRPQTNFGPQRIQFAAQCTLPLHPGPESTAPKSHPSWTPVAGNEFKVRCGPNYPKNGKKENSKNSLYEVYCVRFFRSQKRTVGGATRIMPLPEVDPRMVGGAEGKEGGGGQVGKNTDDSDRATNFSCPELKGTKIPEVLVVHFMLPYEPPNMFKQKDDGPGGECVYYLRPSQRFLDEISGRIPATPATKLFAKWCSECQSNLKMRSRFKCMALVRDLEKHNLGLLKTYNGKPVLITESGRVCSGYHGDVRYLEMTANVHFWAFMAKKGFVSIIPKFKNMQMEVGFTIEAHTDNEMPECMLGSTVLSYISDSTGPMITKEMQQPVHEHQS